MPLEMVGQHLGVGILMGLQQVPQCRTERVVREDRAEGAVQNLPARSREADALRRFRPEFQIRAFQFHDILDLVGPGRIVERCRDVVGCLVRFVTRPREIDELTKECGIVAGRHPQGFQIRGAGRFHVPTALRGAGQGGVHRELVRSGVQTQLVGAKRLGDRGVLCEGCFQGHEVPFVINPFFKVSDQPRREAHQPHPALQALLGDDVVFGQGGRLGGFVDREFDFEILAQRFIGLADAGRERNRLFWIARPYLTAARMQTSSLSSICSPSARETDWPQ